MINAGNFFGLARTQLGRTIGERCQDRVLCALLTEKHLPTGRSDIHRLAARFVPEEQRLRFYVATCYFGRADPEMLVDVWADDEAMEARARMVDAGAITGVPDDAPCRLFGWVPFTRLLQRDNTRSVEVLRRFRPVLGERLTAALLADARELMDHGVVDEEGTTVRQAAIVTDLAHRGLGWVAGTSTLAAGPETSELAIRHLLQEWPRHWPPAAPPWSIDSIIAWAESCARYIEART